MTGQESATAAVAGCWAISNAASLGASIYGSNGTGQTHQVSTQRCSLPQTPPAPSTLAARTDARKPKPISLPDKWWAKTSTWDSIPPNQWQELLHAVDALLPAGHSMQRELHASQDGRMQAVIGFVLDGQQLPVSHQGTFCPAPGALPNSTGGGRLDSSSPAAKALCAISDHWPDSRVAGISVEGVHFAAERGLELQLLLHITTNRSAFVDKQQRPGEASSLVTADASSWWRADDAGKAWAARAKRASSSTQASWGSGNAGSRRASEASGEKLPAQLNKLPPSSMPAALQAVAHGGLQPHKMVTLPTFNTWTLCSRWRTIPPRQWAELQQAAHRLLKPSPTVCVQLNAAKGRPITTATRFVVSGTALLGVHEGSFAAVPSQDPGSDETWGKLCSSDAREALLKLAEQEPDQHVAGFSVHGARFSPEHGLQLQLTLHIARNDGGKGPPEAPQAPPPTAAPLAPGAAASSAGMLHASSLQRVPSGLAGGMLGLLQPMGMLAPAPVFGLMPYGAVPVPALLPVPGREPGQLARQYSTGPQPQGQQPGHPSVQGRQLAFQQQQQQQEEAEKTGAAQQEPDTHASDAGDQQQGMGQQPRHIWVGNLLPNVCRSAMQAIFGTFGPMQSLKIVPNKTYAFISFQRSEDAVSAQASLDGQHVLGITGAKPLTVKFQHSRAAQQHDRDGIHHVSLVSNNPSGTALAAKNKQREEGHLTLEVPDPLHLVETPSTAGSWAARPVLPPRHGHRTQQGPAAAVKPGSPASPLQAAAGRTPQGRPITGRTAASAAAARQGTTRRAADASWSPGAFDLAASSMQLDPHLLALLPSLGPDAAAATSFGGLWQEPGAAADRGSVQQRVKQGAAAEAADAQAWLHQAAGALVIERASAQGLQQLAEHLSKLNAQLRTRVSALEAANAQLQGSLEELRERHEQLAAGAETLEAANGAATAKVLELEGCLATLAVSNDKREARVRELEAANLKLQAGRVMLADRLEGFERAKAAAEGEVVQLRARLQLLGER